MATAVVAWVVEWAAWAVWTCKKRVPRRDDVIALAVHCSVLKQPRLTAGLFFVLAPKPKPPRFRMSPLLLGGSVEQNIAADIRRHIFVIPTQSELIYNRGLIFSYSRNHGKLETSC